MGPRGMSCLNACETGSFDVAASEVETRGACVIEVAVQRHQRFAARSVHLTVDHRDQVEVAHPGCVVAPGDGAPYEQAGDPAESGQAPANSSTIGGEGDTSER